MGTTFNLNPDNRNFGDYSVRFVVLNGKTLPMVKKDGIKQGTYTTVSDARNTNGVFIGDQIGRNQAKIELQWAFLSADEWRDILSIIKTNFVNPVEYFDQEEGRRITRRMYAGDRTATPYCIDENGKVTLYKDCAVNFIDTGE